MASKQEPAYLVTNCAACAAPLAHDAPRCVRCQIDAREAEESQEAERLAALEAAAALSDDAGPTPTQDASLENLRAMLAESDDDEPAPAPARPAKKPRYFEDVEDDADEDARAADLEEELCS